MMFDFQVCLFVNEIDPTNAVIYDWQWFVSAAVHAGLSIVRVIRPTVRGFQWQVVLQKRTITNVDEFPTDPQTLTFMCGGGPVSSSSPQRETSNELQDPIQQK